MYVSLCDFLCLVLFLPFVLEFSLFGFIYLFFPFLPCLAAGRVLVLRPGVGPEPVK